MKIFGLKSWVKDAELIEKTLVTFSPAMNNLAEQYRLQNYTSFTDFSNAFIDSSIVPSPSTHETTPKPPSKPANTIKTSPTKEIFTYQTVIASVFEKWSQFNINELTRLEFFSFHIAHILDNEEESNPKMFKQALKSPSSSKWKEAIYKELQSLIKWAVVTAQGSNK
ncbi:hypothetical protein HK098_008117 [Nowakowskiella sp. JEL0407]|nr:hypothetical protein HK098_008117 [Nowakowskiella sp. JEL0407]